MTEEMRDAIVRETAFIFQDSHEAIEDGQDSKGPWIYSSSSSSLQPRIGFFTESLSKYSVKKDIPQLVVCLFLLRQFDKLAFQFHYPIEGISFISCLNIGKCVE